MRKVAVAVLVAAGLITLVFMTDLVPRADPEPEPVETPAPVAGPVAIRHITVEGAGLRDGSDLANAGRLDDLPYLVAASRPGDEVWIHPGTYQTGEALSIRDGGAPGRPVLIRGADGGTPEIVGTRSDPYDKDGEQGEEVFRLLSGADHLRFANLAFRNQGNGCFRVGADIADLAISEVSATNVSRLLENTASGDAETATITGLVLRNATVRGFSDGAVRLRYDTSDVLLADIDGDAEAQEQRDDDFPIGVALEDSAHDVTIDRVTMRNARSERDGDEYWNGDGFTAERGTYDLRYSDTFAAGNSDAGYDLKSASTTLVRAVAEDNSRNFRLWGRGIEADACVGRSPNRRGGATTQAQVHGAGDTRAVLRDCEFSDAHAKTIVFDIDEGSVTVEGGTVHHAADARLREVDDAGDLTLEGVTVEETG